MSLARPALFAVSIFFAASLVGCADPSVVPGQIDPAPNAAMGQDAYVSGSATSGGERVYAKDTLSVVVYRDPDLSLPEVRVSETGTFEMPLIGTVVASGKAPSEIQEDIRARLAARFVRSPQVTVNILGYGSRIVTVEGDLARPGVFQFEPSTTLLGAIALAGGPNRTADLDRVALFRRIDNTPMVAVYDLREIRAGNMIDPVLEPGDRVAVDYSAGARRYQDILAAIPAIGIFSRF